MWKLKHICYQTPKYIAMYEYTAGDDDEISFEEGDVIVDATAIDDGWMEGRNSRTGSYGMFPSNYVELVSWVLNPLYSKHHHSHRISLVKLFCLYFQHLYDMTSHFKPRKQAFKRFYWKIKPSGLFIDF